MTVLYYGGVVPFVAAWLVGAAAVWLLWRPASTAFFKPPGSTQALHQAHMAELDRPQSSRAQVPASGVSRVDLRALDEYLCGRLVRGRDARWRGERR